MTKRETKKKIQTKRHKYRQAISDRYTQTGRQREKDMELQRRIRPRETEAETVPERERQKQRETGAESLTGRQSDKDT